MPEQQRCVIWCGFAVAKQQHAETRFGSAARIQPRSSHPRTVCKRQCNLHTGNADQRSAVVASYPKMSRQAMKGHCHTGSRLALTLVCAVACVCSCRLASGADDAIGQAEEVLICQLRHGDGWKQVHAAEALLLADRRQAEVIGTFRARLRECAPSTPWHVGCLRVLFRACPEERLHIRGQLATIAFDDSSPGHVHALESMGKLQLPIDQEERRQTKKFASGTGPAADYALMLLAINHEPGAAETLLEQLERGEVFAAFALYYLEALPDGALERIRKMAGQGHLPENFRCLAWKAWLRHGGDPAYARRNLPAESPVLLGALDACVTSDDRPWLIRCLTSTDPGLRIAAARALICMEQ